ncbi:MAG: 6-phosphogluconolactonase [Rhodospirillaceae bacterium]|nr:MAG: 6-phosphogluconolactonase [Rhodospirillaceae bacterium]
MHSFLHTTPENWAETAAQTIADLLFSSLNKNGFATLVVPGGRSAKAILPRLAKIDLDWEKVTVTLTDERWVPAHHSDSNERLVYESFIKTTNAHFIGMKTKSETPEIAISENHPVLAIPRPFDVVFVGMGDDGHIASLFPKERIKTGDLQTAQRPDHPRISMTPTCLLNSRHIVLPILGQAKQSAFKRAQVPGPTLEFPVRHILHQDQVPVTIIIG